MLTQTPIATTVTKRKRTPGIPRNVKEFIRTEYYDNYAKKVFRDRYHIPDQDLPDIMQELYLRMTKHNYLENYSTEYVKIVDGEEVWVKGAAFTTYLYALIKSIAVAYYRGNFKKGKDGSGQHDPNNLWNSFSFDFVVQGEGDDSSKSFMDFFIEQGQTGFEDDVILKDFIDSLRAYIVRMESRRPAKHDTIQAEDGTVYERSLVQVFDLIVEKHLSNVEIATLLQLTPSDISYYLKRIREMAKTFLTRCGLSINDIKS